MKLVLSISWIILNVLCKLLDCTKCTTGVVLSVVHTSNIMTNTWIHPSSFIPLKLDYAPELMTCMASLIDFLVHLFSLVRWNILKKVQLALIALIF